MSKAQNCSRKEIDVSMSLNCSTLVCGGQTLNSCPLVRGGGVHRWGRSPVPSGRWAWVAKRVGQEPYRKGNVVKMRKIRI